MTKDKLNPEPSPFCTFADWHPYLPPELQHLAESDWLRRSNAGNWMRHTRLLGQRSTALYKRADVVAWWNLKWGATHPHLIQQLLDAGFPAPETRRKRRG